MFAAAPALSPTTPGTNPDPAQSFIPRPPAREGPKAAYSRAVRGSVLYTAAAGGSSRSRFRLKGHKLIEASIVVIESCRKTRRGGGQVRRYRQRVELEEASPRRPLRVDGRGKVSCL